MKNVRLLRKILLSLLFLIIATYTLFQSQKLIKGPQIEIYSPKDGSTYRQLLVEVEGRAKNVAYLNMNDKPIFTDKTGYFKEKFLLSPGYNVIKLSGTDKFKKQTEKRLQIIFQEY